MSATTIPPTRLRAASPTGPPLLRGFLFWYGDLQARLLGRPDTDDESPAGVVEHWKQAGETWQDLGAFMDWSSKAKKVSTLHSGTLVQALW
jgi:hypothetical protein